MTQATIPSVTRPTDNNKTLQSRSHRPRPKVDIAFTEGREIVGAFDCVGESSKDTGCVAIRITTVDRRQKCDLNQPTNQ